MAKFDERTAANMDVVLDEVCKNLPHGGDHESRKHIAKKLLRGAKKGNVTLEGLRTIGSRALAELSNRQSATISGDKTISKKRPQRREQLRLKFAKTRQCSIGDILKTSGVSNRSTDGQRGPGNNKDRLTPEP